MELNHYQNSARSTARYPDQGKNPIYPTLGLAGEAGEVAIKEYLVDQEIEAQILDFEIEKERISLGIKQLVDDPIGDVDLKKGSIVTCSVVNVGKGGIDVEIGQGFPAFIKRNELSMDKSEQDPNRFEVGQKVDAKIINFDKKTRRVVLSIKSLQISDEKEAIKQYGSKDSGASLGLSLIHISEPTRPY